MTAPTISAYPKPVEDLLPAARELADQLGEVPSRNRLMKEFKVGSPKATALREALTDADFTAAPSPTADPVDIPPAPPADPDPTDPPAAFEAGPASPVEGLLSKVAVLVKRDGHPDTNITPNPAGGPRRAVRSWPVLLLALPAFVAIWSGWVGLGGLTGFGVVHPLPGIADSFSINTAITLPIGVETYAAYALRVWLSGRVPPAARQFAKWSAIGSLVLGALGQIAYHLMESAGITAAPWWITTLVACLPVAVLGMGAALAHLIHNDNQ